MHTVKKLNAVFFALVLALLPLLFAACKKQNEDKTSLLSTVAPINSDSAVTVSTSYADTSSKSIDTYIILNDENTTINGSGASFSDSVLTISKSGDYFLKGKLSDGRIVVDSKTRGRVCLYLNGVTVHSSVDSPLNITSAGRVAKIILAEKTSNELSDFSDKANSTENGNNGDYTSAVIFSQNDLVLEGEGTLKINAKHKKGIYSEQKLTVLGGNINIESADDALGSKSGIVFRSGALNAVSGASGIRTGSSESQKGSIIINGGLIKIKSELDCIQSASVLTVTDGEFDLTSGGGNTGKAENKSREQALPKVQNPIKDSSDSQTIDTKDSKAVKAERSLTVSGGSFTVNSHDDAFYSATRIYISGGDFNIKTDSNAICCSKAVSILGGNLKVEYCSTGIDGEHISISGGTIYITAENNSFGESGNVFQSNGTVVAFGSESGKSGNNTYTVSGGTLFSAGGLPSKKSTAQRNAEIAATETFPANTLLAVTNADGKTLFCLSLAKNCTSIRFSSPELSKGEKYKIYSGGINKGVSQNGIYYGTQYTPGRLVDTVKAG